MTPSLTAEIEAVMAFAEAGPACVDLIQRLAQRIKELERGEYICRKCGLRKDAEHDEPVEF